MVENIEFFENDLTYVRRRRWRGVKPFFLKLILFTGNENKSSEFINQNESNNIVV